LELPERFLRPILPSPRHVVDNEVAADPDGNPIVHPKLFLLDCRLSNEHVRESFPTLWRYLEKGEASGLADRYLCRHRKPWYSQEDRPPAPFISTYMGRSDSPSGTPFRFVRNRSKATAANVYLLMYPKGALHVAMQSRPELADQIWSLLNRLPPQILLEEGRVYGGGLHKLEPKELAHVPADSIAELIGLPSRNAREQLELLT
jgi:adenine-specific DNA-methyltransferase